MSLPISEATMIHPISQKPVKVKGLLVGQHLLLLAKAGNYRILHIPTSLMFPPYLNGPKHKMIALAKELDDGYDLDFKNPAKEPGFIAFCRKWATRHLGWVPTKKESGNADHERGTVSQDSGQA